MAEPRSFLSKEQSATVKIRDNGAICVLEIEIKKCVYVGGGIIVIVVVIIRFLSSDITRQTHNNFAC